jgi:hypothetical protein
MTIERRQRPIPVTSKERTFLEEQKKLYEKKSGDSGDWGQFLGSVAILALAAIGVYTLANAINRTSQSVDVQCLACNKSFVMALPNGIGSVIHTKCPHCQADLVVNLGNQ